MLPVFPNNVALWCSSPETELTTCNRGAGLVLPVVEDLDICKSGGLHIGVGSIQIPYTRPFLKVLNQLSVGALS
ncbi:MAG: hypothetical protein DID90_2727554881 [Candidatus Nitrotoga sp. LAW]|nr:MAG: hypothetical protein DID90_2727554881 [Candidatus Nitrotoga sp. LAW]